MFVDYSYNIFEAAEGRGGDVPEVNKRRWENLVRSADPSLPIQKLIWFIVDDDLDRILEGIMKLTEDHVPLPRNGTMTETEKEERQLMLHAYILNTALEIIDSTEVALTDDYKQFIIKELYFKSDHRLLGALEIFYTNWDIADLIENIDLIKDRKILENECYEYGGGCHVATEELRESQLKVIKKSRPFIGKKFAET